MLKKEGDAARFKFQITEKNLSRAPAQYNAYFWVINAALEGFLSMALDASDLVWTERWIRNITPAQSLPLEAEIILEVENLTFNGDGFILKVLCAIGQHPVVEGLIEARFKAVVFAAEVVVTAAEELLRAADASHTKTPSFVGVETRDAELCKYFDAAENKS